MTRLSHTLVNTIRHMIEDRLARFRPDVTNAQGVLPPTALPPPEKTNYADRGAQYDAREFWGRAISSAAPTDGLGFVWDNASGTYTLQAVTTDAELAAHTSVIATQDGQGHVSFEQVQDMLATFLRAGANISLTYDDVANTFTIAVVAHSHTRAEIPAQIAYEDEANTFSAQQVINDRLGIGTTPLARLHVREADFSLVPLFERTSSIASARLFGVRQKSTTTADMIDGFGSAMVFAIEDSAAVSNDIGQLAAVRDGADNSGALVFVTYLAGTANERARLDSAGRFGIGAASPHSTLHINGSFATPYVRKTAAYTLTATDHTIGADAAGAAFTLTLPTAVGISGREYIIKRLNAGTNNVTVDAAGSETIDGALTYELTTQWQVVRLRSENANWLVL